MIDPHGLHYRDQPEVQFIVPVTQVDYHVTQEIIQPVAQKAPQEVPDADSSPDNH